MRPSALRRTSRDQLDRPGPRGTRRVREGDSRPLDSEADESPVGPGSQVQPGNELATERWEGVDGIYGGALDGAVFVLTHRPPQSSAFGPACSTRSCSTWLPWCSVAGYGSRRRGRGTDRARAGLGGRGRSAHRSPVPGRQTATRLERRRRGRAHAKAVRCGPARGPTRQPPRRGSRAGWIPCRGGGCRRAASHGRPRRYR
jgi:hypothetical protein